MTPKIEMQPNDGTLITLLGIVSVDLHLDDFTAQLKNRQVPGQDNAFWPTRVTVWTRDEPSALSGLERTAILSWTTQKTGLGRLVIAIRKAAA